MPCGHEKLKEANYGIHEDGRCAKCPEGQVPGAEDKCGECPSGTLYRDGKCTACGEIPGFGVGKDGKCIGCEDEKATPEGKKIFQVWIKKINNYAGGSKCVSDTTTRDKICSYRCATDQKKAYKEVLALFPTDCNYEKGGIKFLEGCEPSSNPAEGKCKGHVLRK